MIQILSQPRFIDGYLYGLSRPSIELIIKLKTRKIDTSLWILFEKITNLTVNERIKNKEFFEITDCLDLINEICSTVRIPVSSNFYVKEIKDLKFQIYIPFFYPKITLEVVLIFIKILNDLASLRRSINQIEVTKNIQDWYQEKLLKIKQVTGVNVNNYFMLLAAERLSVTTNQSFKGQWVLGNGVNSRKFDSTLSDKTPFISVLLAADKYHTAQALNHLGFPGGQHVLIHKEADLLTAIDQIGYPLVIKPSDQERGDGVSSDIKNFEDALIAFRCAANHSNKILVEKHQTGYTHRFSIINHKTIKVVKRIAGGVIGDGIHTIQQLIQQKQASPSYIRRMQRKQTHMLSLDAEAKGLLQQYGLDEKYIPTKEQYIRLRRRDNINAGGDNVIVDLKNVHPDNIKMVEDISNQFNFDIVGIDLIIDSIEKSWLDIGATVCELNAKPQMAAHNQNKLYEDFLTELLPHLGKITTNICIYDSSKIDYFFGIHLLIKKYIKENSFISHKDGIYKNEQKISKNFINSFAAAKAAMCRKDIDNLFILISNQEILEFGSPVANNQLTQVFLLSNTIEKIQIEKLLLRDIELIQT